nr:unnamed protein product [Digitaria exilis]
MFAHIFQNPALPLLLLPQVVLLRRAAPRRTTPHHTTPQPLSPSSLRSFPPPPSSSARHSRLCAPAPSFRTRASLRTSLPHPRAPAPHSFGSMASFVVLLRAAVVLMAVAGFLPSTGADSVATCDAVGHGSLISLLCGHPGAGSPSQGRTQY